MEDTHRAEGSRIPLTGNTSLAYRGGAKLGKDLERGGMGEPLLCLWVFWGWRLRWTQGLPSPPVHASTSSGPRASESWFLDHQAVLWSPSKIPLDSLVMFSEQVVARHIPVHRERGNWPRPSPCCLGRSSCGSLPSPCSLPQVWVAGQGWG